MVEFTQEKINVPDLAEGMYIARLDRPWIGTPFPIQGFHIRNNDDIRLLGTLCRYVYINVIKSRVSLQEVKKRSARTGGRHAPQKLARLKASEASYTVTRTLKQEIPTIGSLHDDVALAIKQVMSKLPTRNRSS